MESTSTPFERAWLLIKGQPLNHPFTKEEKTFINTVLYTAMGGSDEIRKREAKALWIEFLNQN
jgi:hypothetical protein|tara:strand:- start:1206 stop:1394 length:189 start_codon:yes stop_codon:yes gene_type:complete